MMISLRISNAAYRALKNLADRLQKPLATTAREVLREATEAAALAAKPMQRDPAWDRGFAAGYRDIKARYAGEPT